MFRDLLIHLFKRHPTRVRPLIKVILSKDADKESLEGLIDQLPDVENLPTLNLPIYRSLVAILAPPTDEQIRGFAAFISEAKSWYKHLPLLPPGVPFFFFVDPNASMDRVIVKGGRVTYHLRTDGSSKLHYSWLTTETYRSKFGYLSYACPTGSRICTNFSFRNETGEKISVDGLLDNNPYLPAVDLPPKGLRGVPVDVLDQASVLITGIIHPLAAAVGCWDSFLKGQANNRQWPEEAGGSRTLSQILTRCQEVQTLRSSGTRIPYGADPVLADLLAPERERLQNTMIGAMQELRRLLYGV